jgi:outer membrane protein OmpA-like peptidoglycan-associated protein
MMTSFRTIAFAALGCMISPLANASDLPGTEDITARLAVPFSGAKSRSFSSNQSEKSRGLTNVEAKPDALPAIDLNINFEFDSARLTSEGHVLVGNLGRALKDQRLAGQRFRIEGHTDGKGQDIYNQPLSERRADTVRRELISLYGVDAARIDAVGFGKNQLRDTVNPESSVNRRVRVVNLGGEQ